MAMYDHISFVPEVLPIAPRPIAGELISSWLLRVALANGLTLAQLVQGIEARFPEVLLRRAFVDDQLLPSARYALAITNLPTSNGSLALASCWNCGSSLLLYDPESSASSM